MKKLLLVIISLLSISCINAADLDPKTKKQATSYTQKSNDKVQTLLPFENRTDFANANKGFIGTIDAGIIKNAQGKMSYNMKQYDFLQEEAPDTVNPSLWRQGQLNRINGLFKVSEGIYQIRGFDLSNMTLIKGNTGWIIIDPLLTPETSSAGMKLVEKHLGKRPVSAIIISHSHIDHFGGIRGVVDEADVISGKVQIYAPKGFYHSAISENVIAGNAMIRRSTYMFGNLLPKNAVGTVGSGLGQTTSVGIYGIIKQTQTIDSLEGITKTIDGVDVEFIYTPESEAPAEMMFYFPKLKAFCQAENINRTFHNLYTLRGAKVRNGQKWAQYIDKALYKWGDDAEVSFGTHHWPTWGNANIKEFWRNQRNLYRFVHDQTIRLANQGLTSREIAEQLKLPDAIDKQFYNRGYYGSLKHNIKAQYQLYYGWFDGNPANLDPLPPTQAGIKYVEAIGGADALLAKAQDSFNQGDYRWVAELVNHLVFAEPNNQKARYLLADAYEQLGYVAESGPWRNFYLTGAKELRDGVMQLPAPSGLTPDMIKGLSTKLFFDYLAMKFNGTDNDAQKMQFNFNFSLPDVNEHIALIIEDGVVNPRFAYTLKKDVTATITVNRTDLDKMIMKQISLLDLIKNKAMIIEGDSNAFLAFFSKIDNFKFWFNIIEP
jgi:alkyl sulfatase BDS1-like metallo-beta-lactamase superfamily hydrolase